MARNAAVAQHRFFFALLPPMSLADRIVEAMTPFSNGERMIRAERLHITLDILTDFVVWPDNVVAALQTIGDDIRAAPFEIVLDRLSGGERTMALRPGKANAPLNALQRDIAAARARAGLMPMHDSFAPHMTLSYRKAPPVNIWVTPVRWMAEEFVLIHSHIGRMQHTVLGRWALCG